MPSRPSPRLSVIILLTILVRLDDAMMQTNAVWSGDIRRIRVIGDFREWQDAVAYQRALPRLLRDLQA